jgi:enterochelin esterase-like enzyme
MQTEKEKLITAEIRILSSVLLNRDVSLNIYFPSGYILQDEMHLLLINDGQDLELMNFENILSDMYLQENIKPLFCVGITCGPDRRNEYGTANILDYKGRGTKALAYQHFIFEELFPFLKMNYPFLSFKEKSFCGFSLGGLSALDIVWNHAQEFKIVGVFSGSFWWRSVSQSDPLFNENTDRIMHNQIRNGSYFPGLRFFFETGTMDETADRNNNGIIDSIDDTISLIDELVKKGYDRNKDIFYLELKDGRHDVPTWGRAFPAFLKWGWGK